MDSDGPNGYESDDQCLYFETRNLYKYSAVPYKATILSDS